MNIIELAKQAGFVEYELDDGTTEAFDKRYAKFADLVAAQEREECAKVCDEVGNTQANMNAAWRSGCRDAATEIRARGTA